MTATSLPDQQTIRLLLVDDNAAHGQDLGGLLDAIGARLEIVGNAQQAQDAIRFAPRAFDAVLVDLGQAGQDPMLVLYDLCSVSSAQDLNLVAVCDWDSAAHLKGCATFGVTRTLLRPYAASAVRRLTEELASPTHPTTAPTGQLNTEHPLKQLQGNTDFYAELLTHFMDDATQRMQDIRKGWSQAPDKTAAECHALKGVASTLGALDLAAAASVAEKTMAAAGAAMTGTGPAVDLLESMEDKMVATLLQVHVWLQKHAQASQAPSQVTPPATSDLLVAELDKLTLLLEDADAQAIDEFLKMQARFGLSAQPAWQALSYSVRTLDIADALIQIRELRSALTQGSTSFF